jgi:hypothetical protein
MDIFNGKSSQSLRMDNRIVRIENTDEILAANLFFEHTSAKWYDKFNRFGWIDPFDTDQVVKEFLFFTKPDLNLYSSSSHTGAQLIPELQTIPFFKDADARHRNALMQLQSSVHDGYDRYNPFMCLLSNAVQSKLDLPNISADSQESTSNIMGTSIQYRGHSLKSDNGYDFTLSVMDTAYLEIYTMVKAYDEYMRLLKMGTVEPQENYILNRIIPEQFSVYKFLVGSDGETILFYAKLTGCYFTDVPRSDFGDPPDNGFKYSLSFHAQFVEDNNPLIITEFNKITPANIGDTYADTYNATIGAVDNSWVSFPVIETVSDLRSERRQVAYDHRMRWVK